MRATIRFNHAAAIRRTTVPRTSATAPTPYSWVDSAPTVKVDGPLSGMTIALKENISYSYAPTTCSSTILKDYKPPFDATCVSSLIAAGAQIVGMTKMDEFGMGSLTTHLPPYYSPVYNPASPSPEEPHRSAGGSSGGSAAAVAEGSCDAALGTDTGGSVRLPASYCGVVGLKPSYGLISRRGVVAYGDSLDCVGVLAREVDTVERVFNVLSHPDDNDMTCASAGPRSQALSILKAHLAILPTTAGPLSDCRIGVPSQASLPPPYINTPRSLLSHLQSLGATLHPVSLPSLPKALPAYYVLASAEASSNLGRYGGSWFAGQNEKALGKRPEENGIQRRIRVRSEGFGMEVKKRILAGTHALSADEFNNTYLKALYIRRCLKKDYQAIFRIPYPLSSSSAVLSPDGVDFIIHPTAICTAPTTNPTGKDSGQKEATYIQDLLNVPASLAGLPSMSVPAGRGPDGWPIGVAITGQWGMEDLVFRLGRTIEKWNKKQAL
ncbi:aspartyl-tRNA(Asn)/glutamyl-tRNA (Gln) amidotransferase subunit A [Cryptococcus gattii E566]|uniref:Glutamyl-tRNA(Gln) amidotransferase subunit A, mitochondrial n=2 Tax=Cryptococcus gattii TaxID=37769 RepID=E6RC13_CRYGW|nr:Glutamyl-tRNA(Gln) amidotransferase subunit A (Glu-ADT subunit A) [Cryptococcus gattii WM276]ADV24331.1 Glutamyl-tRNA(Gln) amidotransferase subunit A (Glu-ADT subunit A) [Cryptococcus gattii WM276]KIR76352.1 aspartyl-tRNA(Asn)/glutamyl-tRNA (Gln) amidotransferase subunit A [Cryptococcus gattii EJB2]KIY32447.1 aspartyl-tRNA(Asn)/glutamyl-tRNA (Gln) amidotransferase subunit A [Cryptococcus gattii E566]KJE02553.1 aspartyl-tRNA(Asn)/glutamyl-tRNA (Gln) amidotransferase subunit A [Cryptococcus ga